MLLGEPKFSQLAESWLLDTLFEGPAIEHVRDLIAAMVCGFPGYFADRLGTFNTMIITAAACTALIFALWLTSGGNVAAIMAFAVTYGFWSGAAISLTPVCIGAVCDVRDLGKRIGTAYFISSFGALTGIPIAGAILESNGGSYNGLIIFAGAMYTAALIAFATARVVIGGWRFRVAV